MSFRIDDSVEHGEIDNRVRGIVCGTIWLEGRAEPLRLELKGNAHPDLAGCLLTFTNPRPRMKHPQQDTLSTVQRGTAGDLTAARKARVFDLPPEKTPGSAKDKKEPPQRLATVLYLEWFSETNGRVVIESTDYELTISTPDWRPTPEENEQRARDVAGAMKDFLESLTSAIEQHERNQKDPEARWDEHDYEKFLKASDARTDKYMELLDKYGDSDEAEAKIAKEMGWDRDLTPKETEEEQERIEELNRACQEALEAPPSEPEPHREGIDWIRTSDGDVRHPLQHRCFKSAVRFQQQVATLGLERLEDEDLDQFLFEFQIASAKLSGALAGLARGEGFCDASFTVACLKRALDHLHKAQAGLAAVTPKKLLPAGMLAEGRQELFEIRENVLKLMDDFRQQK